MRKIYLKLIEPKIQPHKILNNERMTATQVLKSLIADKQKLTEVFNGTIEYFKSIQRDSAANLKKVKQD